MHSPQTLFAGACCALSVLALTHIGRGNELYVKPGVAPGGSGTSIADPLPTIQAAIDAFEGTRGFVFLHPGVYRENVDVGKATFWFRPVERTGGVVIQGSLTIRRPGVIIRGLDIRSEGSAIILTEGASRCQVLQCRILAVGPENAGVEITGNDISGVLLSDNIVDLRDGEGDGRTGIRIHENTALNGLHLDHNQIAGCEIGIRIAAEEENPGERVLITHNRLLENRVGLLARTAGIVARGNRFRAHSEAAVHAEAGPILLDGNIFRDDAVSIATTAHGMELTNNVFVDPREHAVRVDAGTAQIVHNTMHNANDTSNPLVVVAEGATAVLRHSILSGPRTLTLATGRLDALGNLYSHNTAALPDGTLVGDPGFLAPQRHDFRLRPDSIAAHRVDVVEVGHDAAGIGRPWGPGASIGAYEVEGPRQPRIWHVAAGDQPGDGSSRSPFGSLSRALEQVRPGDTVLVQPGVYTQGRVAVTRSGAPGAPITIRSTTPHEAKMVETTFYLNRCSYVRIEGFHFTGTQFRQFINCGAYVRHCEFVDNVMERTEGHGRGLLISGPGSTHNLIEGNRIALNSVGECRGSGCCEGVQIACQRHNWHQKIRRNDISGCYYAVQTGGGSFPTAPPGYNLIENNVFHHNWADGVHTKSTDDTIRNNIFHGNGGHAITTREGARIVIIGNWIVENSNGIRLHSPSHFVVNNMICNNKGVGIRALAQRLPHYEAPPELWIAHNTFSGNGGAAISLGALSGAHILRNIIVGSTPAQAAIDRESQGMGVVRQADSNLYHRVRAPLLREYEGGRHDIHQAPRFVDPRQGDFRLAADSPARNMPQLDDALSRILSSTPAGVPLPDHIGSNLGRMPPMQ